ncbi:von Willebrand factor A domain-containing 3B, partial [Brachionus plicatilis]
MAVPAFYWIIITQITFIIYIDKQFQPNKYSCACYSDFKSIFHLDILKIWKRHLKKTAFYESIYSPTFFLLLIFMNQKKKIKDLARGDRIIARNEMFGYYFSARVSKVFDSQYASIKFEDGTRNSNISIKCLIKCIDTFSYLQIGDHVMAKVLNEFDKLCWVPGVIQSADSYASKKYYVVLYFNGLEGDNIRTELIKISRQKYAEI